MCTEQIDKLKCSSQAGNLVLNQSFWNDQYKQGTTGWDLAEVSPPLKAYIDQLTNKNVKILIPGCGNAYEAGYLLQQGYTNITIIDIAPDLVIQLKKRFKGNPNINIVLGDFFTHEGSYDLVLEQTFFCALDPLLRSEYISKMNQLIAPGGKLVGVLFNREFDQQGPPFGGHKSQYTPMFEKGFNINTFELCYNSFVKRAGTELFINLQKKQNDKDHG